MAGEPLTIYEGDIGGHGSLYSLGVVACHDCKSKIESSTFVATKLVFSLLGFQQTYLTPSPGQA